MRTLGVMLLVACGGCDVVLHLQEVGKAATDAATSTDTPGACTGHDEDLDGVPDVCDNCPTVSNADQANVGETKGGMAADAVGDACDPNPGTPGDRIALFTPFVTIDGFDASGTLTAAGEQIILTGDSAVLSQAVVSSPTLAVAQVSWNGSNQDGEQVVLAVSDGNVHCGLEITNGGPAIYASGAGGSQSTGWSGATSQLTEIRYSSDQACTLVRGAFGSDSLGPPAYNFVAGKVGVAAVGPTSGAIVRNLIVYGN